jgi:hypothetical protein
VEFKSCTFGDALRLRWSGGAHVVRLGARPESETDMSGSRLQSFVVLGIFDWTERIDRPADQPTTRPRRRRYEPPCRNGDWCRLSPSPFFDSEAAPATPGGWSPRLTYPSFRSCEMERSIWLATNPASDLISIEDIDSRSFRMDLRSARSASRAAASQRDAVD